MALRQNGLRRGSGLQRTGRCILAVLIFALFVSSLARAPVAITLRPGSKAIPASFFGLHIHHATDSTPWPPFPVPAWRLWDIDTAWSHLQPQPDDWEFKSLDKSVELAEQHHAEILLVLGQSPRWAASHPDEPSALAEPGGASAPKDMNVWRHYVRKVANRYKGRIRYYEIWNEANLPGFYSGTVSQMVTLAKEAYKELKEVDQANVVLSPSGMGRGSNIQWLDDFFSQGGGRYCDVIAYHFYVTPAPPEEMLNVIGEVKQVLKRHDIVKPVWDTETGWDMDKKFVDDEERMGYLARAYILAWASGVERLYWYAYDNYNWASLPLTLPGGHTLNPAGKAYSTLQSWLINSQIKSCSGVADGAWSCELITANDSQGWILWSTRDTDSLAPINCCKHVRIRYLDGRTETRNLANGLQVGRAPILVENAPLQRLPT
jgi:hypothetical protein